MTTDEEATAAKAAKSARHQSEVPAADRLVLKASLPQETDLQLLGISSEDAANSIALQKQFEEANISHSLVPLSESEETKDKRIK